MGKDERKDAEFTHYIEHMVRGQWGTAERDRTIKQTAAADMKKFGNVAVRFEVEGGSSGKDVERDTIRMLAEYDVKGDSPTGSKEVRAIPFARQVEAGNVALVAGEWNQDYLDNIVLFPNGGKDEMDGSSGAFNALATKKKVARARARA
jgi:predicted phage terminase large subunit-like protein